MPRGAISHEQSMAFDKFANAFTVMTEPHRMCHDGFMFHTSGRANGIANDASVDFIMVVPADCYPHVQRLSLDLEAGDVDFLMYENTVVSNPGSPLPRINTNRNSSIMPAAQPYGAPTITADGDLFHTRWAPPTGTGVGAAIGILDVTIFGEEWILAPSKTYMFRITNRTGAVLDLAYEFVWYEIGEDSEL